MGDPQPLREVLAADALLLRPEDAAKLLRVGRTTIYALMKAGIEPLTPTLPGRLRGVPGRALSYVSAIQSGYGTPRRGSNGGERGALATTVAPS
jgi:hypothetical protein